MLVVIGLIIALYRREIRAWYLLVTRFDRLRPNAQGYLEYRHEQTGIIFVRLPGGTFLMGSPENEFGSRINERPQHEVKVEPFLIAKYEVQYYDEWRQVMGRPIGGGGGERLPAQGVTWNACQEFCLKTGLTLPVEAQWEYACRAGTTTAFAFGDNLTTMQANFGGGGRRAVPVDSFKPNRFGLYNMHGNVHEWCQDVYEPQYVREESERLNNEDATLRVFRGGNYTSDEVVCRSAFRSGLEPSDPRSLIGFRPVFNLP